MTKFVELLKARKYTEAVTELDSVANCFGFTREAEVLVEEAIKELVYPELMRFCVMFIISVSKKPYTDERCDMCVNTAKTVINTIQSALDNFEVLDPKWVLGFTSTIHRMHPTVMQAASQVPFYFIAKHATTSLKCVIDNNEDWWKMPLI